MQMWNVMKKFLLVSVVLFVALSVSAQDFPYAKMLTMTPKELKEKKFKYDENRNQWVLKKSNGWQTASIVLSALNGATADIRPDKDDYMVVIQRGEGGVASIDVTFYDDDIWHDLLTFTHDNGQNLLETNSGKITKYQFEYDLYSFVLQMESILITSTTGRTTSALVKTKDESFNAYHFIILTGIEPSSPYLTKEAAKQQRREEKGRKKQSVSDLM